VVQDEEVRDGMKKFSQWPTFPQLYAGGEFMGGCDIVLEMQTQGGLKSEIDSQIASKKQQA